MLIVIDGLDGSGKTTQFEIIKDILAKDFTVTAISFPDYKNPSCAPVKMYLNGEISAQAEGVNAYAASSFYAVDRYISYKKFWERDYLDGGVILASRYVSSNAIHQMPKLPENEWDSYLEWLCDYEYKKLSLPAPNCTILLDMPVSVSQRLLTERYGFDESKKDIHESDTAYMELCRRAALYAAERLGWKIIPCTDGELPLSVNAVTEKILNIIKDGPVKDA